MGSSAGTLRGSRAASASRMIDKQLSKEKNDSERKFKILLLGGSECGKTTIFKQMRILHLNGFTEEQIKEYRSSIHRNCIEAMKQLLDACDMFKYKHELSTQEDVDRFREYYKTIENEENAEMPVTISRCIERMWSTNQVQAAYVRRFSYQLLDSAKHFLENMARIGETTYTPSLQDILYCRFRTVGISEMNFHHKKIDFHMVDVGGQRTERRKWIHCFDNVDMILFVIALSDYDLLDPEDKSQNRMLHNFEIFKTIVSSEMFRSASIVLFLNKYDIFKEKLRTVPLSRCWNNYKGTSKERETSDEKAAATSGDNSVDDASEFIKKMFGRYVQHKHKFFVFTTLATDTENIERVFSSAVAHIVHQNLRSTGLHD